jgi:hypothetical protein
MPGHIVKLTRSLQRKVALPVWRSQRSQRRSANRILVYCRSRSCQCDPPQSFHFPRRRAQRRSDVGGFNPGKATVHEPPEAYAVLEPVGRAFAIEHATGSFSPEQHAMGSVTYKRTLPCNAPRR